MSLAPPTLHHGDAGLTAKGISHVVLQVVNLAQARDFYMDVVGLHEDKDTSWPDAGAMGLVCQSGQRVVLVPSESPRTFAETGVHVAYAVSSRTIPRIMESLADRAIEVHRYHEDRPEEVANNFYFSDPDGNRIQLVARDDVFDGVQSIDHSAVQASDIEWAEEFYVDTLGLPVVHRVGWNTADYVRSRLWADGKDYMAPGTRRWDQRYRAIPGRPEQSRRVARPNMQVFVSVGPAVLGIYLALAHFQEPAPYVAFGTPRTAYAVDRPMLTLWAECLASIGVAMRGPIEHKRPAAAAASLYFRDPCGNFVELAVPVT